MTNEKRRRLRDLRDEQRRRREARIESGELEVGTDSSGLFADADQPDFLAAYVKAAGYLLGMLEMSKEREDMALPIFYLQRHALELGLKLCLRIMYAWEESRCAGVEPSRVSEGMRKRLERHGLVTLSKDLKRMLTTEEAESPEIAKLIELAQEMSKKDVGSIRARYGDEVAGITHRLGKTVLPCRRFQDTLEWLHANVFDLYRDIDDDDVIGSYSLELGAMQNEAAEDGPDST